MAYVPFPLEEFPDDRDPAQRAAERAEVAYQVQHFRDISTSPRLIAERVERLQRRRATVDMMVFECLSRSGAPPYVAAYEYLLPRDQAEGAQGALDRYGLCVAGHADRCGHVRLAPRPDGGGSRGADTRTVAGALQAVGLDAELNYVVPLGVWMKGPGGPEPSSLRRRRPQVAPAGPVVAVLDNGVTDEQRTDGFLVGLVEPGSTDVDLLDVLPPQGKLDMEAGHGSFVAGVVQQVFPAARVDVLRVSDSDGVTTVDALAERMLEAVERGAGILSLSLGTPSVDGRPPRALLTAVEHIAHEHPDVVIVAAAGNNGDEVEIWPGAFAGHGFDNVVAVAGLDPDAGPSSWSTRGGWVTFSAIGEGVVSTYVVGTEDGELIDDPRPDTFEKDSWAVWTGTSFATPQVAAAIARIGHEEQLTPRAALAALRQRAEDAEPVDDRWGRKLRILPGT